MPIPEADRLAQLRISLANRQDELLALWKDVQFRTESGSIFVRTASSLVDPNQFARDVLRINPTTNIPELNRCCQAREQAQEKASLEAWCPSVYDALRSGSVREEQVSVLRASYNQAFSALFTRFLMMSVMGEYGGIVRSKSSLIVNKDSDGSLTITVTETAFELVIPATKAGDDKIISVTGSISTTFKVDVMSTAEEAAGRTSCGLEIVGFKTAGAVGDLVLDDASNPALKKFAEQHSLVSVAANVEESMAAVQGRIERLVQVVMTNAISTKTGRTKDVQVRAALEALLLGSQHEGFIDTLREKLNSGGDKERKRKRLALMSIFRASGTAVTECERVPGMTLEMHHVAPLLLDIAMEDVTGRDADDAKCAAEVAAGFACHLEVPRDSKYLAKTLQILFDYALRMQRGDLLSNREAILDSKQITKVCEINLVEFLLNSGRRRERYHRDAFPDTGASEISTVIVPHVQFHRSIVAMMVKTIRAYPTMDQTAVDNRFLIQFTTYAIRESLEKTVDIYAHVRGVALRSGVRAYDCFLELMKVLGLQEREYSVALSMLPLDERVKLFRKAITEDVAYVKFLRPLLDAIPPLVTAPPLSSAELVSGYYMLAWDYVSRRDMRSAVKSLSAVAPTAAIDTRLLNRTSVADWYLLLSYVASTDQSPEGSQVQKFVMDLPGGIRGRFPSLFACYDGTINEGFSTNGTRSRRSMVVHDLYVLVTRTPPAWGDKKDTVELVINKMWEASDLGRGTVVDVSRIFIDSPEKWREILTAAEGHISSAGTALERLRRIRAYSLCDPALVVRGDEWQKAVREVNENVRLSVLAYAYQQVTLLNDSASLRQIYAVVDKELKYIVEELSKLTVGPQPPSVADFVVFLLHNSKEFTEEVLLQHDEVLAVVEPERLAGIKVNVDFTSKDVQKHIFAQLDKVPCPRSFQILALRWFMNADKDHITVENVKRVGAVLHSLGSVSVVQKAVFENIFGNSSPSAVILAVFSKITSLFASDSLSQVQCLSSIFEGFDVSCIVDWMRELHEKTKVTQLVEAFYLWTTSVLTSASKAVIYGEKVRAVVMNIFNATDLNKKFGEQLLAKIIGEGNSALAMEVLLLSRWNTREVVEFDSTRRVNNSLGLPEVKSLFHLLESVDERSMTDLFARLRGLQCRPRGSIMPKNMLVRLIANDEDGSAAHNSVVDHLCKVMFSQDPPYIAIPPMFGESLTQMMNRWFKVSGIRTVLDYIMNGGGSGIAADVKSIIGIHALTIIAQGSTLPEDIGDVLQYCGKEISVEFFTKKSFSSALLIPLLGKILQQYPEKCGEKLLSALGLQEESAFSNPSQLRKIFEAVDDSKKVSVGLDLGEKLLQTGFPEDGSYTNAKKYESLKKYTSALGELASVEGFPFTSFSSPQERDKVMFARFCYGVPDGKAADCLKDYATTKRLQDVAAYAKTMPIDAQAVNNFLRYCFATGLRTKQVKMCIGTTDNMPQEEGEVVIVPTRASWLLGLISAKCRLRYLGSDNKPYYVDLSGKAAELAHKLRVGVVDNATDDSRAMRRVVFRELKKPLTRFREKIESKVDSLEFSFLCCVLENPNFRVNTRSCELAQSMEEVITRLAMFPEDFQPSKTKKTKAKNGGWRELLSNNFLLQVQDLKGFAINFKFVLKHRFGIRFAGFRFVNSPVRRVEKARRKERRALNPQHSCPNLPRHHPHSCDGSTVGTLGRLGRTGSDIGAPAPTPSSGLRTGASRQGAVRFGMQSAVFEEDGAATVHPITVAVNS